MSRFCTSMMCGAALALIAGAADAQAADETPAASSLEVIVVTARKREESSQSVPVAVSDVSAQQIRDNLTTDLAKLGELAPQVSMTSSGSGTGAIISIRGVASAPGDAGVDQSVALEFDGVPLSRGRIMAAPLFDIASVQVLQGPQALFFGKNSPAGVISIRSADPTDSFEAYVIGDYEFEAHERSIESAVSGPLTDTLTGRLAFRASKMRGWLKNAAQPHPDIFDPSITVPGAAQGDWGPDTEDVAARLTLRWEPTTDFDAVLRYSMSSRNRNGDTSEPFCINDQTVPLLAGAPRADIDCRKDRVRAFGAVASEYGVGIPYFNGGVPYQDSEFSLGSLTLTKRFKNFTLTSTTGHYDQTSKALNNLDYSPYSLVWVAQREDLRLWTEELRASSEWDGPVNISGGVYYETSERPFLNTPDIFHTFNPVAGNYASNIVSSLAEDEYISAFAHLRWDILADLELAGGARWSRTDKTISIEHLAVGPAFPNLLPVGAVLRGDYDDENISPEVTLTWFPQPDHTLYAAYKTGYKAGGLSNAFLTPATQTPEGLIFDSETSEGFELGYKATVLDQRLRFDIAAYTYDYSDLQVVTFIPPVTIQLQNAASARIEGVQGSVDWLVTQDLTLRGNFGWNSPEYTSYPNSPCFQGQTAAEGCVGGRQDLGGHKLFLAPELTLSVGGEYRLPLTSGWKTTLSAQARYSSSYNVATDNAPGGYQKSYWLLNAGVRTGPEDGRYELALVGRNLTDEYYLQFVNSWTGGGANQYIGDFSRPREVALQAIFRW